jgi:hypothetical protein
MSDALDPDRPIREAGIEIAPRNFRLQGVKQILKSEGVTSACDAVDGSSTGT